MAVSALKHIVLAVLLVSLAGPAWSCFGPKLYLGVPETLEGEVLAELAALYVKEKTGVESILVPLAGASPVGEILAERVDLAVAEKPAEQVTTLLAVPGIPLLLTGDRPLEDLQFTTVGPALRKLAALLDSSTFAGVVNDVKGGEPVKARVRRLLMERAWI